MTPEELFEQHIHLAPATIFKMFKNPRKVAKDKKMALDDLTQYAYEGLWKSCLNWDAEKSKFPTHAINMIKWHVMDKLRDDDNYKYYKSKPNSKENNVNIEYMDNTLKDDGGTLTYHEVVASNVNVYDEACGNVIAPKLLDLLTDRQKEVLLMRSKGYTYQEIGSMLGVTKQAILPIMRKVNYKISKIKDELEGVM